MGLYIAGALIYLGLLDIRYKELIEYATILAVTLFFATFVLDFKKHYLGVQIAEWGL